MLLCIKVLGNSIVAAFIPLDASIVEVMNTLSVDAVGNVLSSFFIVCLCGRPNAHDLPLMYHFFSVSGILVMIRQVYFLLLRGIWQV